MSVEMNESYYRCLSELRTRYMGRGIAQNLKNEKAVIEKKDEQSFVLFDSRSNIADCYRSGTYNGSKYMTSDDFIRYFKTRRAFYMPEALRRKQEESEKTSPVVAPQRRVVRGGMRESSDSKEGHLKTLISALTVLKDKWFPMEPLEGRVQDRRLRVPVAALSGLAVFTISLGLIVGGSVMIGSASGELGSLNSEIAVLEAQQSDLEGKLDLKYSVNELEEDASELVMIKREYADNQYISAEGDNEVIIYEENEDKNVGLAALLAAFGIEID